MQLQSRSGVKKNMSAPPTQLPVHLSLSSFDTDLSTPSKSLVGVAFEGHSKGILAGLSLGIGNRILVRGLRREL